MIKYKGHFEEFSEQGMEGSYLPLLVIPNGKITSILELFQSAIAFAEFKKIKNIKIINKKGNIIYNGSFSELLVDRKKISEYNGGKFEFNRELLGVSFEKVIFDKYLFEIESEENLVSYENNILKQYNEFDSGHKIIKSILDLDLYKLTMQAFAFEKHQYATVSYKFDCRNRDIKLGYFANEIYDEIKKLDLIKLSNNEESYLRNLDLFSEKYLEYLRYFKFDSRNVFVTNNNGILEIEIGSREKEVSWINTILYETMILGIVNEIYFRNNGDQAEMKRIGKQKLENKILFLKSTVDDFKIMEFGTRRRFSSDWQEYVLDELLKTGKVLGTSNVFLAMKKCIKPLGTHAHESLQAQMSFSNNMKSFQTDFFNDWYNFYGKKMNTALTDIIGTKAFLNQFNIDLLRKYDGFRHDSGDPYLWGRVIIEHLKENGEDPKNKKLIFSDGLDLKLAYDLYLQFIDHVGAVVPGIGAFLTNDLGMPSLSIVLKMNYCMGLATAKLSDNIAKKMCDDKKRLELVEKEFIPLEK